ERVSNARGQQQQQDDFELRAALSIPEEDESTLNSRRRSTSSTTPQMEASQPTASLVEEEDDRVDSQGLPSHVYTQTAAAEGTSRDHNEDIHSLQNSFAPFVFPRGQPLRAAAERPLDRFRRVLEDLRRSTNATSLENSLELWKRYYRSLTHDDKDVPYSSIGRHSSGRLKAYLRRMDGIIL
ncbi:hypothetical protein FOZ62_002406, partial [Perkinsus olseni]